MLRQELAILPFACENYASIRSRLGPDTMGTLIFVLSTIHSPIWVSIYAIACERRRILRVSLMLCKRERSFHLCRVFLRTVPFVSAILAVISSAVWPGHETVPVTLPEFVMALVETAVTPHKGTESAFCARKKQH